MESALWICTTVVGSDDVTQLIEPSGLVSHLEDVQLCQAVHDFTIIYVMLQFCITTASL